MYYVIVPTEVNDWCCCSVATQTLCVCSSVLYSMLSACGSKYGSPFECDLERFTFFKSVRVIVYSHGRTGRPIVRVNGMFQRERKSLTSLYLCLGVWLN